MSRLILSRRQLSMISFAALGAVGLVGCQGEKGGGGGPDSAEGQEYGPDDAADLNEQPVEKLQKGGELTLPVSSFGPNWNVSAVAGYFGSTIDVMSSMRAVGDFNTDVLGEPVLNKDYFRDAKEEITKDKKQVLHYELNPDAVWNDGTPINWETYKHTIDVANDADYDSVANFDNVEKIEMGNDEWHFSLTMKEIEEPWQGLLGGYCIVHPDVNTPELFNDGFVDDPRPDWASGPFIMDKYDKAGRVVSVVPNPNWWGEEPVLDRINFAQYETSGTIPPFQNGQIDYVKLETADRYSELTSWQHPGDEYDIRRGQGQRTEGILFNIKGKNVGDVAIRKAIFQAIDRKQLAEIRFQGLNWTEEVPGSWLLRPFYSNYQDNYPVKDADVEGAKKTLDDAGWTGGDDEIRKNKDGDPLKIQLSTFGDDPTQSALAQSFQTMMKAAGIDIEIFSRGSGESTEALNTQDYAIVMSGYGAGGADPSGGPLWFWGCDNTPTGACDKDMDKRMEKLPSIVDVDGRAQESMAIEKEVLAEFYHFLPIYNGPEIGAYRHGLANYGPRFLANVDWTRVGWEKGVE
jgi:peptide/nickel transport system substrate-binding protein